MELVMERTGRSRSGRKKITDKKITVPIYPRASRIETLGIDYLKEVAIRAIEKEYLKKAL